MKPVLVTGFEPFGGEQENPSQSAAEMLDGRTVEGRPVTSLVLPCVFGEALQTLRTGIRQADPELVICVGQAGGRPSISLERVAINLDDAGLPDNAGAQPIDKPIVRGGPAAYWSTLPIKAIAASLNESGIRAEISQTAGTFVCNHVFYGLMRTLKRRTFCRGGFIHVPYLPSQAKRCGRNTPCMPLSQIVRGLELAIQTSLTTQHDLSVPCGATH